MDSHDIYKLMDELLEGDLDIHPAKVLVPTDLQQQKLNSKQLAMAVKRITVVIHRVATTPLPLLVSSVQSPRTKAVQKQDGKLRKGKAQVIDLTASLEETRKIASDVAGTGKMVQQFLQTQQQQKAAKKASQAAKEAEKEARHDQMLALIIDMLSKME